MSLELRRHSHGSEVLPQCCLRLHIVHCTSIILTLLGRMMARTITMLTKVKIMMRITNNDDAGQGKAADGVNEADEIKVMIGTMTIMMLDKVRIRTRMILVLTRRK